MDDLLKIGCPICGSVLSVKRIAGIESGFVTCPICHQRHAFLEFKSMGQQDKGTDYTTTQSSTKKASLIGKLRAKDTQNVYDLHLGRNVIGRMAPSSSAQIQLPCPSKRMSREHVVIDVKQSSNGYVHVLSLFKPNVNQTFIQGLAIDYSDQIELEPGMVINLPDVSLEFIIEDSEKTLYL